MRSYAISPSSVTFGDSFPRRGKPLFLFIAKTVRFDYPRFFKIKQPPHLQGLFYV